MQGNAILKVLAVTCAGTFLAACNDEATSPAPGAARLASADVVANQLPQPFAVRAPLGAFFINQAPGMMIRSDARADFALQRLVTNPGPGGWHTHPGPSFGIVEQGRVLITRFTKKEGCVSTTYGPGEAYYEVADEVHRATVLEPDVAVEYKARFYVPVGAAFSTPAAAPDCS